MNAVEKPRSGEKQEGSSEKPITMTIYQVPEPLEKIPLEDLLFKISPEQPTSVGQSLVEKKTVPSTELTFKGIESRERRFLVFFKPSSAELEDSSYDILRQLSDYLSANPNSGITLTTSSTQDAHPGLSAKLLELRVTSIRSGLAAQPKFQGKITVIDSYVQRAGEDQEISGSRFSKPWAEIRVE